jgi:phosphoribosyl-AMP cyclohydrolase / phosphoribosyl-ATP pyrophosphohydrolase
MTGSRVGEADPAAASALAARVRFGPDGLVPAVVQDAGDGRVLTQAWMSRESLERTLATGETWFWSRSREELWRKGATSGNTQAVRAVLLDCDQDALLVLVDQTGVACHTGAPTCFGETLTDDPAPAPFAALTDLERTIAERAEAADPDGSYTARLLAKGIDTVCKKVGEEATEVVLAAKGSERGQVVYESADLLYHLTVLWGAAGVSLDEVAAELDARRRPGCACGSSSRRGAGRSSTSRPASRPCAPWAAGVARSRSCTATSPTATRPSAPSSSCATAGPRSCSSRWSTGAWAATR